MCPLEGSGGGAGEERGRGTHLEAFGPVVDDDGSPADHLEGREALAKEALAWGTTEFAGHSEAQCKEEWEVGAGDRDACDSLIRREVQGKIHRGDGALSGSERVSGSRFIDRVRVGVGFRFSLREACEHHLGICDPRERTDPGEELHHLGPALSEPRGFLAD